MNATTVNWIVQGALQMLKVFTLKTKKYDLPCSTFHRRGYPAPVDARYGYVRPQVLVDSLHQPMSVASMIRSSVWHFSLTPIMPIPQFRRRGRCLVLGGERCRRGRRAYRVLRTPVTALTSVFPAVSSFKPYGMRADIQVWRSSPPTGQPPGPNT